MEIELAGHRNREIISPRMGAGRRGGEDNRERGGGRGGRLEFSKFISTDNGQVMLRILMYVCISYNGSSGGLEVLF